MEEIVIRTATIADIPFLVETIIEAEKSGTDRLSYSTIFGLSEAMVAKYLEEMLLEEIDGCELSVSSFLVAEVNGVVAAALSAWIEGDQGISSTQLKGNLLNFVLPKENIAKAALVNSLISEIHIEYTPNSIQIGAGYVSKEHRGKKLLGILNDEIINRLSKSKPDVSEVYAQIFSCNTPSIKTYEKANFKVIMTQEAKNQEIINYLPSNKKILLKKQLNTNNKE
jgi:hypothetical protein